MKNGYGNYNLYELNNYFYLDIDLFNIDYSNLDNLMNISDSTILNIIISNKVYFYDEILYYQLVDKFLELLVVHNKKYNIRITISNRNLFKSSKIMEKYGNKFNFSFYTTFVNETNKKRIHELYNYDEYTNQEEFINNMIKPIINSSLSLFERFIAIYNLVKKFKKYNEDFSNNDNSGYLKYVLHNEFMTCRAFSKLLKTFLDKVSVSSLYYELYFFYPNSDKKILHARNIVYIKDDKYNIDGFYFTDATFDNNMDADLYFHALMTGNSKKYNRNRDIDNEYSLLLEFNNYDEFINDINKIINIYGKKDGYRFIFSKICELLSFLDICKYREFILKYYSYFTPSDNYSEEVFNNFINEYFYYIFPKINNNISIKTITHANEVVSRQVYGNSLNKIKKDTDSIIKYYNDNFNNVFTRIRKR